MLSDPNVVCLHVFYNDVIVQAHVGNTPISLVDASLAIMASMALLQKGMKRGRSASSSLFHHFSYVERLDRLKLESLESPRIKHHLCLFYKLVNNLVVLDVHDSYSFRESYRGHGRMLFVNFSRTEKRKFYWINRIAGYWNSLSNDIVNAPSIAVFCLKNIQFTGRGSMYCV